MSDGIDRSELLELFREEAEEYLATLNDRLPRLAEGDGGVVEELFRVAHTLKGSAGLVGLGEVQEVAHSMEDLLGRVRDAGDDHCDLLFTGLDLIETLLEEGAQAAQGAVAGYLTAVQGVLEGAASDAHSTSPPPPSPSPTSTPEQTPAAVSGGGAPPATGRYTRVPVEELEQMQGLVAEVVVGRHRMEGALGDYRALWRRLEGMEGRLAGVAEGLSRLSRDPAAALGAELGEELTGLVAALKRNLADFRGHVGALARTTHGLQDHVSRARLVEVRGLFQRFHRLVREASRESGRRCRLELAGETTRIDKVVVERLHDPLVHLVRNALAHGIEPIEERRAAGKPPEGRVLLGAETQGDAVVIRVSDDGRGLDPAKLRAAAAAKGLLGEAEAAALTDDEAAALIFRPGFSIREEADDLAGRGVGMDAVRDQVGALGGRVSIQWEVGRGTTFILRVPLSLAITRGILFTVGGVSLALPMAAVHGVSEVVAATLADGTMDLHGEAIRYRYLGRCFGWPEPAVDAQPVIVVASGKERLALGVDRLHGQEEMVLRPLSPFLSGYSWASAATVGPDGDVRLLLDLPALFERPPLPRQSGQGRESCQPGGG